MANPALWELLANILLAVSIFTAGWSAKRWWEASKVETPALRPLRTNQNSGSVFIEGRSATHEAEKAQVALDAIEGGLTAMRRGAELNAVGAKWAMITALLMVLNFALGFLSKVLETWG
jgi:hypothetical protein